MDSDFPPGPRDTLTTLVDVVRGAEPSAPRSADTRLVGRRLEGRYEILRPLDRGGMATVYVALDHRLDREVAVKVMHPALAHDPAFVARFRREARAAASIRHRNVVAVTDSGTDGDPSDPIVFLVMDLVRGRTLRALLAARRRLTPAQALEVLEPVLAALDAAHTAGLVHRDVKPENVLLGDDGTVEVADFGLARAIEASALTTHAGMLMGTVAYVAPEQVSHGTADTRSDVYAAGVLLFELLTGRPPYEAETPVAVAYRHVHEDVPAPSSLVPGLPPELDDLVLAATGRDPGSRYPDAGAYLAAVRRARRSPALRSREADRTIVLPPARPHRPTQLLTVDREPEAEPRVARRRRRWPWVLLVLVLLSTAAGFGGWWLARDAKTHVPALTTRDLTAYEASLSARHLTWTVGSAVHSDSVPDGQVVTTSPAPGAAVKPHSTVVIAPSAGVLRLTVPVVAGTTQQQATAAVVAAGFATPTAAPGYSDTIPAGMVISSTPAGGALVDHRTTVTITVSQGPAPVTVPDVTGQTQADATKTLQDLGLDVTATQAFSATVPSGTVISMDPPAGPAHRGDPVTIVVSKGPQLVAVPDVTGLDGDQAAQVIQQAGLVPREVALFGVHGGQVVTQSPRGGMVKPGTTVTYYTAY